jgi:hypothetical protein
LCRINGLTLEFKINYMKAATGTIMAPTAARG